MTVGRRLTTAFGLIVLGMSTPSAQHEQMPPGMTHEEHLKQIQKDADLQKRGARAMGFGQDKATHHFRLTETGGVIEVTVNDAVDRASRAQIRSHLKDIANDFSKGVFDKPFATHAEVPPGVPVMARLKGSISYTFEETPAGALVRIRTPNVEGRQAVHDFLRYQIKEHATGDAVTVTK